jgi:hypothetical protein
VDHLGDKIRLGKHKYQKSRQKEKKDDENANEDRAYFGLATRIL